MKYTFFALALLVFLQVVYAQTEDIDNEVDEELADVEHFHHHKKCLVPILTGYLGTVKKVHDCPYGKPFSFRFKVAFENNVDHFSFIVKICRRKHKPQLPKNIFNCALHRGLKQCKTIGLPKCVTRRKAFLYRRRLVSDCLAKVLRECSNGEVKTHQPDSAPLTRPLRND